MAKLKYIKKKPGSIILTLDRGEQVDMRELEETKNKSSCEILLYPNFYNNMNNWEISFAFKDEKAIALSRFLRHPINKDQFYIIIAQILDAYKMIVSSELNPAKINLDPDHITISKSTGYVYIFYQPIINLQTPNQGIMRCIGQICSMLKCASPQDQANVNGFIAFVSHMTYFSVDDIETFIMNASPFTYNYISGHTRTLSENPVPANANPVPANANPVPIKANPVPANVNPVPIKANPVPANANPVPVNVSPVPNQPVVQVPAERNYEAPIHTASVPPVQAEPAVTLPARLIRRSDGSSVVIDKDAFIIGKESAKVNYCISGNRTVSRVHATIYHKGGSYYVVDNNSTNRTFINGTPIMPMTEIKLKNKNVLKLSNEEFDFIET